MNGLATWCGRRTLQSWGDLMLWEALLNAHPGHRGIVELGTWEGGFSRFLSAQAIARGMRFVTIDKEPPVQPPPNSFVRLDLFADGAPAAVRAMLAKPGVLLCDDGDKPAEVDRFAPVLTPGELLVVHDWGTEIGPTSCDYEQLRLRRVHEDLTASLRAMSAVFVKE